MNASRGRNRKYKSVKIMVKRPLTKGETELTQLATVCEFRLRWGPTIGAWLCILLGFALAIVNHKPDTGEYTLSLGKTLSFQGGFGGLLVVAGAVLLWLNRPTVGLIFQGDDKEIEVRPKE